MERELGESEMGTKEYWDAHYVEEIRNYRSHGDVGDVWFGDDIFQRILNWMNENVTNKDSRIVDLGCGNGLLVIELCKEGFRNIMGVDYSEGAINLAKEIATQQGYIIQFVVGNILSKAGSNLKDMDIVLDKGTYDAISLSANAHVDRKCYIENVHSIMKADGQFVITSCNWTKDELDQQMSAYFVCKETIPTPQFKFGGKVGNVVTSVVYLKK